MKRVLKALGIVVLIFAGAIGMSALVDYITSTTVGLLALIFVVALALARVAWAVAGDDKED